MTFRVAFNDAKDKHGSPISAAILVDRADKNEFRSFLSEEIDNIFFAAEDEYGNPIEG